MFQAPLHLVLIVDSVGGFTLLVTFSDTFYFSKQEANSILAPAVKLKACVWLYKQTFHRLNKIFTCSIIL